MIGAGGHATQAALEYVARVRAPDRMRRDPAKGGGGAPSLFPWRRA